MAPGFLRLAAEGVALLVEEQMRTMRRTVFGLGGLQWLGYLAGGVALGPLGLGSFKDEVSG